MTQIVTMPCVDVTQDSTATLETALDTGGSLGAVVGSADGRLVVGENDTEGEADGLKLVVGEGVGAAVGT